MSRPDTVNGRDEFQKPTRPPNIITTWWTPNLLRVRAYIDDKAVATFVKPSFTLQSFDSAVAGSATHARWLVFDTAPELRYRVGAYDMIMGPPIMDEDGDYRSTRRRVISAINLDVAIAYVITNYRNWNITD